jgi:hypothetical protein
MTSSVGKQGSQLMCPGRNRPRQRPGRRLATAPPHAGITRLKGDECGACAGGVDSPIQGFVGPIALANHRGCHGHDGDAFLIES